MKLEIPPEPELLKNLISKQKRSIESKIDSLTLWFGNKIPSYIWKEGGWAIPLKKEGYNWQSFLQIFALHKKDIIRWSWNTISWKELLIKIEDTLKDPIFKKILIG
jgi:hypothetical protein